MKKLGLPVSGAKHQRQSSPGASPSHQRQSRPTGAAGLSPSRRHPGHHGATWSMAGNVARLLVPQSQVGISVWTGFTKRLHQGFSDGGRGHCKSGPPTLFVWPLVSFKILNT